jgi:signal transduction histidine kinase
MYEKEYFRSDGSRVPVLIGATSITQSENLAFVLDLTERKRAEEERERLRHAQADLAYMSRVITVGELAASLAHEIKQPIAAAVLNAKTCVRWLERDSPDVTEACEAASRTARDATRAADIVDRVRSLYRRGAPQRELVDLNEIILEMSVLLHDKANRYAIPIRAELTPGLPKVTADRVQLQQVVMNLMLNGIEAMENKGGELTVTSKTTEDCQLLISVSDSGIGLPVEESDRIFEAFFTTKPEGTGMGLSISRTIVESHGGRLWASPNTGRGATFHFSLPAEAKAIAMSHEGT